MRPKAIQTYIHRPETLDDAMRQAVEKWDNWTIIHGPTAFWQTNLFTNEMDAIVIATVKPRRGSADDDV